MNIRACRPNDAPGLCRIYNHYVLHSHATFEIEELSPELMARRIETCTRKYPWLVSEIDSQIAGFAYANIWRERAAYEQTVEVTVYLDNSFSGQGIGKALYQDLITKLVDQGYHIALACIALPNEASIALHESLGFRKVAHFEEVGWKFDRWCDVGYWQRKLS